MAAPSTQLQCMLQSAVQSVQWTYSLFWQISTQTQQATGNRMLVWADGYYNGGIKTRKTVQPMEVSTEEASLQRSQQLRDLYDSLSSGETDQPVRRPCAALSPEDLTESEWFYLMCISFSFPPGVGLPGKAYARKQHVWIIGANEIDSRIFSRAILAKSARIKTVVCIPLMDGVVELGTTDKVEEDIGFIQHIKSIFDEPHSRPPKPALSELSTSNSATSFEHCNHLYSLPVLTVNLPPNQQEEDDNDSAAQSDFETETSHGGCPSSTVAVAATTAGEPSELMQLELSEDIRLGSPDDGSNNLDANFHLLTVPQSANSEDIQLLPDYYKNESDRGWSMSMVQDPSNPELQPPPLGTSPAAEFTDEDTHYSHMVSTVLQNQNQSNRWSDPSSIGTVMCSTQSAFSKWTSCSDLHRTPIEGTSSSQWLLKHILHNVPLLHTKHRDDASLKSRDGRWRWHKGTPQDELSGNHVLAERRRREKLNEKFIMLRSIVPFVTKMDKASILGDTIEYVKQLRNTIQDLEARSGRLENDRRSSFEGLRRTAAAYQQGSDKRKLRILEGVGGGGIKHKLLNSPPRPPLPTSAERETNLQVSIIETDGLLELQCPYKEGLLLNIMQILQQLRIETTAVQSSLSNGVFVAEIRAKVKENMNGKKASITEVKRAIQQIIPHIDT